MLEGVGADGGARQAVPAAAYQERPAHAAVRLYVAFGCHANVVRR